MGIESGKDILLLLLYSPGETESINEPIEGRTRLVKAMFLFNEEIYEKFKFDEKLDKDNLPEFFAWDFGPFSTDVYDYIDFFERINFIQRESIDSTSIEEIEVNEFFHWLQIDFGEEETSDECFPVKFSLTEQGGKFVEKESLFDDLSDNQKQILKRYKNKVNSLSLNAILQYIYRQYPEYAEKSKIKKRVVKRHKFNAL